MNLRELKLMNAPDWESVLCPFCGKRFQSRHHVVYRSQGGGSGPTITVCGTDNVSGCHGLIHQGYLHLDYTNGRWVFLRSKEPCSSDTADSRDDWKPLVDWDRLVGIG